MRVCIVTVAAHGMGGMQDHTRDLARGLVAAGHDVEVIGSLHPEGLPSEQRDGVRWWYPPLKAKRERLPRRDPRWLRASYETFLERERAQPFDVIHSESTSAIEFLHRGVHRRVPLVATFHGNAIGLVRASLRRARQGDARVRIREAKHLVWLAIEQFQYGHWYRFRSCEWMVPSHQQFDDTRRDGLLRASRGHVVPNGIDAELFRPRDRAATRAELGLPDGPLLVGVGRLNAEKGFHLALRALHRLDPALGARLVIVGRGEERDALLALTEQLGITDRVMFVGRKTADEVARYMAAADVFVFPTQREEAAPLVLPQALAAGAPVIASSIGGITEVIGEGHDCGVLIPPGDEDALVRELDALLRDPERREQLSRSARQRVLDEYTLERMVERTVAIYEIAAQRLAAERGRRA